MLYLHGLSTGDFGRALRDLLGEDASGLSTSSIARLTEQWQADHAVKAGRKLTLWRWSKTDPPAGVAAGAAEARPEGGP